MNAIASELLYNSSQNHLKFAQKLNVAERNHAADYASEVVNGSKIRSEVLKEKSQAFGMSTSQAVVRSVILGGVKMI